MHTPENDATGWRGLRRLRTSIVVVDLVESVRLMQHHEAAVIDRWRQLIGQLREQVLPAHGGRMVKSLGDGALLVFDDTPAAVKAAVAIQDLATRQRRQHGDAPELHLRCAVHSDEVVVDELDIYGAGVNLSSRLATLAGPGDIILSSVVRDTLVPGLDPDVQDLGECYLKHLDQPVRAFRLDRPNPPSGASAVSAAPVTPVKAADLQAMLPTLAVLPFEAPGSADEDLMVGELLADGLVHSLSARSDLHVISRLSMHKLRHRAEVPREFLRSQGVSFTVSGRCFRDGQQVLVQGELTDITQGRSVWSGRFSGPLSDLFVVDSQLIADFSLSLQAALLRSTASTAAHMPLPNMESFALQLGALQMMHGSVRESFGRAGPMLEHLIERHARVPSPRAWLGKWYVLRMTRGLATEPALEARRALDLTRRALDVDPDCALALAVEGFVHCHLFKDLDTAADRLDHAVRAGPNEALAWLFRGVVHAFSDEGEQAVACCERARALSPLDPLRYYFDSLGAAAAVAAGQHERAVALAQQSLQANAMHSSTYRTLAIALSLSGRGDEARRTVTRLLQVEPNFTVDRFLARVPGGDSGIALRFARALRDAGVPAV